MTDMESEKVFLPQIRAATVTDRVILSHKVPQFKRIKEINKKIFKNMISDKERTKPYECDSETGNVRK